MARQLLFPHTDVPQRTLISTLEAKIQGTRYDPAKHNQASIWMSLMQRIVPENSLLDPDYRPPVKSTEIIRKDDR